MKTYFVSYFWRDEKESITGFGDFEYESEEFFNVEEIRETILKQTNSDSVAILFFKELK